MPNPVHSKLYSYSGNTPAETGKCVLAGSGDVPIDPAYPILVVWNGTRAGFPVSAKFHEGPGPVPVGKFG